jgi:integrase
MRKLTPIAVENLKPKAERYEVPDRGCAGLYVVVQPSGRRAFAVRCRANGRSVKITLPPGTELGAARKEAAAILDEARQGRDPAAARRAAKSDAADARANTLRRVAEQYLALEAGKLRTGDRRRDTFERTIYPVLGARPIGEIRRGEVIRFLDLVEANAAKTRDATQGGARAADEVLLALSRLFNWWAVRDETFRTPLVRGMRRSRPMHERARTRVLDDDEIGRIWHAATAMGAPSGAFLRFLLLTTARRSEAAGMRWNEVQGLDWLLPAARNKTKVDLVRPLSGAALSVLAAVPRVDGCEFVFMHGTRPISNFSKLKREVDERSSVAGWRLHDLRRTARSLMSRAGVNVDHAERCLGHVIGGVRGTYDRHAYYAEKKHAFEALAALVERIINPQANVVTLRS